MKDIGDLSYSGQTSSFEPYHNVLLYFALRMVHYFYSTMKARVLLACLHYNENSVLVLARSESGQLFWNVSYPKYNEGVTVQEVKISAISEYIQLLKRMVQQLQDEYPTYKSAKGLDIQCNLHNPPSLASMAIKQDKVSLVSQFTTRFPNKLNMLECFLRVFKSIYCSFSENMSLMQRTA